MRKILHVVYTAGEFLHRRIQDRSGAFMASLHLTFAALAFLTVPAVLYD